MISQGATLSVILKKIGVSDCTPPLVKPSTRIYAELESDIFGVKVLVRSI